MKRVFSIIIFCLTVLGFFAPGRARGHSASWEQANGRQNACAVEIFDSCLISYDARERLETVLIPQKDDPTSLVPYLQVSYQGDTPKVASLTWGSGPQVSETFSGNNPVIHTDTYNVQTDYSFKADELLMLCEDVSSCGRTISFEYNSEYNLAKATFPEKNHRSFLYYRDGSPTDKRGFNNITQITSSKGQRSNPSGGVTGNDTSDQIVKYTYESKFKQIKDIELIPSVAFHFDYNTKGNVVAADVPHQSPTFLPQHVFEYNEHGQATKITYPDGTEKTIEYYKSNDSHEDASDREGYPYKTTIVDQPDYEGEEVKRLEIITTHDHYGRLISQTDPSGATRITKFNDLDQIEELLDVPQVEGDENSRLIERYNYDHRGFLKQLLTKNPVATGTVDDPTYEHVTSVVDCITDGLGRLVRAEMPIEGNIWYEERHYYNDSDKLHYEKSANGNHTIYFYDLAGRLDLELRNMPTHAALEPQMPGYGVHFNYNKNDELTDIDYSFPGNLSRQGVDISRDWADRSASITSPIFERRSEKKWNEEGLLTQQRLLVENHEMLCYSNSYQNGFIAGRVDKYRNDARYSFEANARLNTYTVTDPNGRSYVNKFNGVGENVYSQYGTRYIAREYTELGALKKFALGESEITSKANLQNATERSYNNAGRNDGLTIPELGTSMRKAPSGVGGAALARNGKDVDSKAVINEVGDVRQIQEAINTPIERNNDYSIDYFNLTETFVRGKFGIKVAYDIAGRIRRKSFFYNTQDINNLGTYSDREEYDYDPFGRIEEVRLRGEGVLRYLYYPVDHANVNNREQLRFIINADNKVLRSCHDYNIFGVATLYREYYNPGNMGDYVELHQEYYGEDRRPCLGYGRLKSETTLIYENGNILPNSEFFITYSYDQRGKRTALRLPNQRDVLAWNFQDDHFLQSITLSNTLSGASQEILSFIRHPGTLTPSRKRIYDKVNFRIGYATPHGNYGLIEDIDYEVDGPNPTPQPLFSASHDKIGLKNGEGQWESSPSRTYTYDELGRLTNGAYSSSDPYQGEEFVYDEFDQRLQAVIDGKKLEYKFGKRLGVIEEFNDEDKLHEQSVPLRPVIHYAKVNFEPDGAEIATNDLIDVGQLFGEDQLKHGWKDDRKPSTFYYDSPEEIDATLRSGCRFVQDGVTSSWKIAVHNGLYIVEVVAGDQQLLSDACHKILVEDKLALDFIPENGIPFGTGVVYVAVDDRYLDITCSTNGATNCVINYLNIISVGTAQVEEEEEEDTVESPGGGDFERPHDKRGNLVADQYYEYEWDAFDRIKRATDKTFDPNDGFEWKPQSVTYLYDSLGRRIARKYSGHNKKWESWSDERAIYDGFRLLEERDFESGRLLRRYYFENAVHMPVVVQEDEDGDGEVAGADDAAWILMTDDHGRLMGVMDKNGVVVEKLHYSITGLAKPFDQVGDPQKDKVGNPSYCSFYVRFGFAGMYREEFTGKYHTHYRDYDPLHGCWLSRDPFGILDGVNEYLLYGYVNGVDALGGSWKTLHSGDGKYRIRIGPKGAFQVYEFVGLKWVLIEKHDGESEDAFLAFMSTFLGVPESKVDPSLRAVGGLIEVTGGVIIAMKGGPSGLAAGSYAIFNGMDNVIAGVHEYTSGTPQKSLSEELIHYEVKKRGGSEELASNLYSAYEFLVVSSVTDGLSDLDDAARLSKSYKSSASDYIEYIDELDGRLIKRSISGNSVLSSGKTKPIVRVHRSIAMSKGGRARNIIRYVPGGGGKGRGRFKPEVAPWQRKAYQRSDIDWDYVRPEGAIMAGKSNWEAAELGYAPVRINQKTGKIEDLILHHINEDPRGAIVETWRTMHSRKPFHNFDNKWRKARADWADAWRREQSAYWRWRTDRYNPLPTDKLRLPGDI